jgi:hypothetical protein
MDHARRQAASPAASAAACQRAPLERTYVGVAPYSSDFVRQVHHSAYQLAKATRGGFEGTPHFIMGILSSESPIIRAVRAEFMVAPAEIWPSLRKLLDEPDILTICNKPPMTPACKQIFYAAFQTAYDANRKARAADFLVHFFEYANGNFPHEVGVLGILADFDLTQAPVVSFIKSHEHLEPPLMPDPPAPRPEPRVWKSAADRYADWRIRPAAKSPPDPPVE